MFVKNHNLRTIECGGRIILVGNIVNGVLPRMDFDMLREVVKSNGTETTKSMGYQRKKTRNAEQSPERMETHPNDMRFFADVMRQDQAMMDIMTKNQRTKRRKRR